MEFHVHAQQVLESIPCDLSDRSLSDSGEHRVSYLREKRCKDSRSTICQVSALLSSAAGTKVKDSHPATAAPAKTHTVVSAVMGTFKLSTICLKKNGTCTFRTLPATNRPSAPMTLILVRGDSRGHMFSANFKMILQSVDACCFSDTRAEGLSGSTTFAGVCRLLAGAWEPDFGATVEGSVRSGDAGSVTEGGDVKFGWFEGGLYWPAEVENDTFVHLVRL